jgi:5-methylcytosine-specific restriction endonuclease McrA
MSSEYVVGVPEPELTIDFGSPIECCICGETFVESHIVLHHTSYNDNKGVYLCSDCHYTVHSDNDKLKDLEPDCKRGNGTGRLYTKSDYSASTHLYPDHYYLVEKAADKVDVSPDMLVTGLVYKILEKHNGDILQAINNINQD